MENKTNYGEIVYTIAHLLKMDGYNSDNDPEFLTMPSLFWHILENECRFVFWEDQVNYRNNPYQVLEYIPDFADFSFRKADENRMMWTIAIPVSKVKQLSFKAVQHIYENYDVPIDYSCIIELINKDKIEIIGKYVEDPDFEWGFEHKVRIKEYAEG